VHYKSACEEGLTNILLINIHSSRNAGDAALLLATLQQLRQNFPGCLITLAMDDPDPDLKDVRIVESISAWVKSTSKGGWTSWRIWNLLLLPLTTLVPVLTYRLFSRPLYILTPRKLRLTIQSYLRADLIVSKPGGFLYSAGSGLVFLIIIFTLALAWMVRKPFYIFPQSFGPFDSKWEGQVLRWILNKARIVMVREPVSLELLHKTNLHHPHLVLLPDIAFTFQGAPRLVAQRWLYEHGIDPARKQPLLGLTVINWGAQNRNFKRQMEYEDAYGEAIRFFVSQLGGRAILFPQVTGPSDDSDDRVPARRIVSNLADISDSILLVESQPPPELIKTLYGQMDIFVGTRMHSNIFALSEGVPVIAIGYMHKTKGISKMLKMDEWVLDIQEINPKELKNKLATLWQDREILKTQINSLLPLLVKDANRAGILCAEDFANLREA